MSHVGVSTSSFFPLALEDSFRLAKDAGACAAMDVLVHCGTEENENWVLEGHKGRQLGQPQHAERLGRPERMVVVA